MAGRRFHRTMEMIPARPWSSKSPSVSTPMRKQSTKQGNARGTSEVRRGTSFFFHFDCPVPGRPVILGMDSCMIDVASQPGHAEA